jgi:hypothetical protein
VGAEGARGEGGAVVIREEMDTQLQRYVVLKGMPGDTGGYWDALRDIPLHVLSAAVTHGLRTRMWFPTPAEIRMDCDVVHLRTAPVEPLASELPPVDLDDPYLVEIRNPFGGKSLFVKVYEHYNNHCETCKDTGRAVRWCGPRDRRMPWVPDGKCARPKTHAAHDWVEECVCVDTNPVIKRKKEAALRYSQEPEKVGR